MEKGIDSHKNNLKIIQPFKRSKVIKRISHIKWEILNTENLELIQLFVNLNFLKDHEQTTDAERHWIVERTTELNKLIYFRNA